MQGVRLFIMAAFLHGACIPALAVEGPTAAGPIGGTDIRSAVLPPAGLYGGVILFGAISAKLFWNNYLENRDTHYLTGDLLNVDFAVTERIGRFQIGATGFYAVQIEDDKLFGVPIPPDGRRAEILHLGGIVAFDMPEQASSVKLKALSSVFAENTPTFWSVVFGWFKKF